MTDETGKGSTNDNTERDNPSDKQTDNQEKHEHSGTAIEGIQPFIILCTIGVIAFITVFVATSAVIAVDHGAGEPTAIAEYQTVGESQGETNPPDLTRNGWATLAGHFVPVEVTEHVDNVFRNESFGGGVEGSTETSYPLNDILTTIPPILVFIIPLCVLPVAGYAASKSLGTHTRSVVTATVGASSVVIGYAPAVVVMSFYAKWELQIPTGWMVYQPSLFYAGLIGGLIIPMAYASIGGAIAYSVQLNRELKKEEDTESSENV